jgi:putative tryptophan/tyrosine transport system substrate-binding protein
VTPIVMFTNYSVGTRFVASLAHPGGNITGVLIPPEGTLVGKRLDLLKDAVPRAGRIAVLSHGDASSQSMTQEAQKGAVSLGVTPILVEVRSGDYDGAFARIAGEGPDALFVLPTRFFFRNMKPIIELAAGHRLPAIYEWREQVEAGASWRMGATCRVWAGESRPMSIASSRGRTRRICPWSSPPNSSW